MNTNSTDRVLLPLPGIGTLALTRDQFETALKAGQDLAMCRIPVASGPVVSAGKTESELLDAEQLQAKTGIPSSWWMTQARERRIPFRKLGRRVRFAFDEVMACEAYKRRALSGEELQSAMRR